MKIAVMGCGNMGRAIITGLHGKRGTEISIVAFDKIESARESLPRGVTVAAPRAWFAAKGAPDAVVIAVKPQDIDAALKEIRSAAGAAAGRTLWISIAAGITLEHLEKCIGRTARICRAMPNTPALIGEGASAWVLNKMCGDKDAKLAQAVLGACGLAVQVSEKHMDAVTGLSGSGPAYVYLFIEALIEGGVTAGLPYDIARQLAAQTVIGAAKMVASSPDTPSHHKAQVMSPGGTTARGLMELEKQGLKYGIMRAVTAAARRAAELGMK